MICGKRIDRGVKALELRLSVFPTGNELEVFAFLDVPIVGVEKDQAIITDFLIVSAESPAGRCAVAIESGNKTLLRALKKELLGSGFPRPCTCPDSPECNALGSAEVLQDAFEKVWEDRK